MSGIGLLACLVLVVLLVYRDARHGAELAPDRARLLLVAETTLWTILFVVVLPHLGGLLI